VTLTYPLFAILLAIFLSGCGSDKGGGGGTGSAATAALSSPAVANFEAVIAISAGYNSACALKSDGTIWCWGDNHSGQLGTNVSNSFSQYAVKVSGISTAVGVSVGTSFACASLSNGKVNCWGTGILGHGTNSSSTAPVEVAGISTATTAISVGHSHACVVLASGSIKCWGTAASGELGNGSFSGVDSCVVPNDCSFTPVTVSGISTAQSVSAGNNSTCALLADNSVRCWGLNSNGDLGTNNTVNASSPAAVAANSVTQLSTGKRYHTCVVDSGHSVLCWGFNRYAQLGTGTDIGPQTCGSYSCSMNDLPVSGINSATHVASGPSFTCALLADQTVKCWGINNYGEVGNQSSSGPDTCGFDKCAFNPTTVVGLMGVTALAAGTNFACAITTAKNVKCWGTIESYTFPTLAAISQNSNTTDLPLPTPDPAAASGPHLLVVSKVGNPYSPDSNGYAGTAGGSATSTPAAITCSNCNSTYAVLSHNTAVTLSTTLNPGTLSVAWGGDCAAAAGGTATVTMNGDKFCTMAHYNGTANFLATTNTKYNLTITKTGPGTGTVTSTTVPSSGTAINCGSVCSRAYPHHAAVNLTATPAVGSSFLRWAGNCGGTTATISIGLGANSICTAVFTSP